MDMRKQPFVRTPPPYGDPRWGNMPPPPHFMGKFFSIRILNNFSMCKGKVCNEIHLYIKFFLSETGTFH